MDLKKHLVPNHYTLIYFSASWCPACQALNKELERILKDRDDVAIRKIDIGNWKTAVAQQAAKDFALDAVPYIRIYGPNKKFLGHVKGNDSKRIQTLITPK